MSIRSEIARGRVPELDKGPRLLYDFETGEGYIQEKNSFTCTTPLLRMDVIRDWIDSLNELYDEAKSEWDVSEKKP